MRLTQMAVRTHVGRRRANNEDCGLQLGHVPLLAIADGMGGHAAGEVASALAIARVGAHADALAERAASLAPGAPLATLREGLEALVQDAHQTVIAEARARRTHGMGTTLVIAMVAGARAVFAHVGDSRAYLFRAGTLHLLTVDHSLAMLRHERGELSWEEAQRHPDQHKLYQAIGANMHLDVAMGELELADGDLILLCSDGLSGPVPAHEISRILAGGGEAEVLADRLVEAANTAGGPDNITVALARVEAPRSPAEAAQARAALLACPLFGAATDADLAAILPWMAAEAHADGARLFAEGDDADALFIVVQGAVDLHRGALQLERVQPGGHLGELALVGAGAVRSADATARGELRLLRLSRDAFDALGRRRPALGLRLTQQLLAHLGGRLRDLTERLDRVVRAAHGKPT